ncbi:MAG: hypothetical protein ACFFDW_16955, partial [Candidatus Thorarchaeota archaeon]
ELDSKTITNDIINKEKPSSLINDFQYGFYQTIIQNEWLFEKSTDRERVGLEKYAIDEAKISLNDLNELLKSKLIQKNIVSHPSGNFSIISAKKNAEKIVIREIIKKFLIDNRIRFNQKRYEFQNWNEFGLQKKCWEFDFTLDENSSVICLLIPENITKNIEQNSDNLSSDEKELIKALIAVIELKMGNNGSAIIITNSKDHMLKIDKFVASTGWGEVTILDFSNNEFFNELQYFF